MARSVADPGGKKVENGIFHLISRCESKKKKVITSENCRSPPPTPLPKIEDFEKNQKFRKNFRCMNRKKLSNLKILGSLAMFFNFSQNFLRSFSNLLLFSKAYRIFFGFPEFLIQFSVAMQDFPEGMYHRTSIMLHS